MAYADGTNWQVGTGNDNVLGLAPMLRPPMQPRGITPAELRFSAAGCSHPYGVLSTELVWNDVRYEHRAPLIAQFGLSDAEPCAPVTVRIRDNAGDFQVYNANAHLVPGGVRSFMRWDTVTIRLVNLALTGSP